ncbi:hypothetical protein VNO80_31572 [Phaseolus coccineus]|uniref:Uncharacterized protein n=1 Tax=Phaseolus coccineus TaxID=3886 RepID=A0AAN9L0P9_PHACN
MAPDIRFLVTIISGQLNSDYHKMFFYLPSTSTESSLANTNTLSSEIPCMCTNGGATLFGVLLIYIIDCIADYLTLNGWLISNSNRDRNWQI